MQNKKNKKLFRMNFQWRNFEYSLIKDLVSEVKKVSDTFDVNAHTLIRGALLLASKKSPDQLLEAMIEAEKKSQISNIA